MISTNKILILVKCPAMRHAKTVTNFNFLRKILIGNNHF